MADRPGLGDFLSEVLDRHGNDRMNLLQVLRAVQDRHACVPPEATRLIAQRLGITTAQVQAVVDFYSFLHGSPQGRYDVLFSDNIVDRMAGKQAVMDRLCRRLGVEPGITRGDGLVSVNNTSCTGMSDQGPAALVNGYAVTRLTPARVDLMAELIGRRLPLKGWPQDLFRVQENVRREDIILGEPFASGTALRAVVDQGPDAILAAMDQAGLRGMGGAGFKTAAKWRMCRDAAGGERYVVCNADEGEPGTFKDRVLLQGYADLILEGMTLCARVIGARTGYLYLRGEYRYMVESLAKVLARRRAANLLGRDILGVAGFDFDVAIHLGAGAYICGEESALIESLEGKRGVPRKRPPFPVTQGNRNEPTVVNNVETFAAAAKVAVNGAEWFASAGTQTSKGTKLLSISGDCRRPGVYEFPFGVTVRDVLEECGADDTLAVQVAGPAGHLIPAREFHRRIAYEDLATGGSLMVFNRQRDVLDVVQNFAHFFMHESCGFCTPCRVGTSLMRDLVDKVHAGRGTRYDLEEMRSLGDVMKKTSHCGLGSTAANTVLDSLDRFPEVYESRLKATAFEPAFDLDAALSEARALTHREDAEAHL